MDGNGKHAPNIAADEIGHLCLELVVMCQLLATNLHAVAFEELACVLVGSGWFAVGLQYESKGDPSRHRTCSRPCFNTGAWTNAILFCEGGQRWCVELCRVTVLCVRSIEAALSRHIGLEISFEEEYVEITALEIFTIRRT